MRPPSYVQSNAGRMLQVELRIPEAWKKIVIGPADSIEYPNIPQSFSMFMTGESTGALKPYLLIEDSTGKEYSIILITVTHANKGQTETCPLYWVITAYIARKLMGGKIEWKLN